MNPVKRQPQKHVCVRYVSVCQRVSIQDCSAHGKRCYLSPTKPAISTTGSEIRRHALNLRQMPESGKGLGYKSQPSDRVESVWVVMLRVGNYCCLQIPWGIVSIQTTSESRLSSSPAIFGSICH